MTSPPPSAPGNRRKRGRYTACVTTVSKSLESGGLEVGCDRQQKTWVRPMEGQPVLCETLSWRFERGRGERKERGRENLSEGASLRPSALSSLPGLVKSKMPPFTACSFRQVHREVCLFYKGAGPLDDLLPWWAESLGFCRVLRI